MKDEKCPSCGGFLHWEKLEPNYARERCTRCGLITREGQPEQLFPPAVDRK